MAHHQYIINVQCRNATAPAGKHRKPRADMQGPVAYKYAELWARWDRIRREAPCMLVKAIKPKGTEGWRWQTTEGWRLTPQAVRYAQHRAPGSSEAGAPIRAGSAGGRCWVLSCY